MLPELEIAGRKIGAEHPPVVIAEIGINHGGSLSVAIEMAGSAINAGAEIVKHQTHIVEDEMIAEADKLIPDNASESIFQIMRQSALSREDEEQLKKYIESRGAIFLSTPFSRAAVDRLEELGVSAYKIGSGECNNYPLIRYIASKAKPVILSTGMNSLDGIEPAVRILREAGVSFALLHCTNVYPTPASLVRLKCIDELRVRFPDAVVGLSDHTIDNLACLSGVALGASIIERHFTDHKLREGPDIVCSMDEQECRDLIDDSKRVFEMLKGGKARAAAEISTSEFAFASVVSIKDIEPGDVLSESNMWVKRPGTGDFPAALFEELIGKKVVKKINSGEFISRVHVEGIS